MMGGSGKARRRIRVSLRTARTTGEIERAVRGGVDRAMSRVDAAVDAVKKTADAYIKGKKDSREMYKKAETEGAHSLSQLRVTNDAKEQRERDVEMSL